MVSNRFLLIVTLVTLLSGCGGGGGGSGSGSGSGTSGTMPAKPAGTGTGACRQRTRSCGTSGRRHAVCKRGIPARFACRRGLELPRGREARRELATDFNPYTNTITHVASSSGVTESGTHPFNEEGESNPIRFEGGAYISTNQIAFSANTPAQAVDLIELRSPVKVNDQYASIDKHIADSGADFDDDKVNDALDIALYSTVIGEEILNCQTDARSRLSTSTALARARQVQQDRYRVACVRVAPEHLVCAWHRDRQEPDGRTERNGRFAKPRRHRTP